LPYEWTYPTGFKSRESYRFKFEQVWLQAEDGVWLNAWYVPTPESTRVLVVFHGSAVNLGYLGQGLLESHTRLGVNVLALDYRGFGKSFGRPYADDLDLDAEAVWRYLTNVRHFRAQDIFLYGHSIGAAVAAELAAKHPCGGVILESGFTSSRDLARLSLRIPLMVYAVKQRFNSVETIRKVRSPVLVVHGKKDDLIPIEMGKRLYEAAPEPKAFYVIETGSHDDGFIEGGQAYRDRLRSFVLTGR